MKRISFSCIVEILLCLYIVSIYLFTYQENLNLISNLLALTLISAILIYKLFNKKNFIFNKFLLYYVLFVIITLCSTVYAIDPNVSLQRAITMVNLFVLVFFIMNYLDNQHKLTNVLKYFVWSGFIASTYILITTDFTNITRIGESLGNVNAVGMMIGISSIITLFFIVEQKRFFPYVIFLLVDIIVVMLTGSRKSLLLILISFLIVFAIRVSIHKKITIKQILLFLILSVGTVYSIFKIPLFYEIIGIRLEEMSLYFREGNVRDFSLIEREEMGRMGLQFFYKEPILGYGIDNYRFLYSGTYSHNNFIELLVGVGMIGTIVYYLLFIRIIINLYKLFSKKILLGIPIYLFSILIAYIVLSISLVYYYSKHLSFLLAIAASLSYIVINEKKSTSIHVLKEDVDEK